MLRLFILNSLYLIIARLFCFFQPFLPGLLPLIGLFLESLLALFGLTPPRDDFLTCTLLVCFFFCIHLRLSFCDSRRKDTNIISDYQEKEGFYPFVPICQRAPHVSQGCHRGAVPLRVAPHRTGGLTPCALLHLRSPHKGSDTLCPRCS